MTENSVKRGWERMCWAGAHRLLGGWEGTLGYRRESVVLEPESSWSLTRLGSLRRGTFGQTSQQRLGGDRLLAIVSLMTKKKRGGGGGTGLAKNF